ncbi:helix-hairpin-helix domain-containing protein [Anaerovibrio sp.]|uniref:helix-hairpin-helix domain-containing protein n=1 Tax=Anaerovibrio sp. TaxID=1872532 RepID=UPI003F1715C5
MFKRSMAVLLLIALVAAGMTVYELHAGGGGQPLPAGEAGKEEKLLTGAVGEAGSDARQIAVYVTGEVQKPGVVYVAFDSRVADAVNACGGVLPTADLNKVNMAQPVKDGLHIKVPEKQPAGAGSAASGAAALRRSTAEADGAGSGRGQPDSAASGDVVNINTADAAELTKLKGIGPAMAQRIVEYREENGAFQSPEELQRVRGIGKAKFAKMKDQIAL